MSHRVVAVATVITLACVFLAEPAQADWFDAKLRAWTWEGPVQDRHALKLAPDEDYERYYFGLEDGTGVAYVSVIHEGTNDSPCSGEVAALDSGRKFFRCDELRIGHLYRVVVHAVGTGDITLWGEDV